MKTTYFYNDDTLYIHLGNNIYFISRYILSSAQTPILRYGVYERYFEIPEYFLFKDLKLSTIFSMWTTSGYPEKNFNGWVSPLATAIGWNASNRAFCIWYKDALSDNYDDLGLVINAIVKF